MMTIEKTKNDKNAEMVENRERLLSESILESLIPLIVEMVETELRNIKKKMEAK